ADQRAIDPAAQWWLGRLLLLTKNEAEAEQVLRRTAELKPADSRVWNALLALHPRKGNQRGLMAILEQLKANNAIEADQKNLLLGQAYAALGNLEEAKLRFSQVAIDAQSDLATQLRVAQFFMQYEPEQAKPYLQTALRLDPKSSAARRMLAIVDASHGNLATAERFLAESEGASEGNTAAEDVRLHAALLVRRGDDPNLSRAIALLEQLGARGAATLVVEHLAL